MIYDCIIFFNSIELLLLRLMTLYDTVDRFVVVESGMSHIREPKKYYYEENLELFNDFCDKIIYVKILEMPSDKPNENEAYQRNCISQGIESASEEDYIMVSDEDEIPSAEAIKEGLGLDKFKIRQKLFYYYVNCLQNQEWDGPVLMKKKFFTSGQLSRNTRNYEIPVVYGGWHYSFLGGVERIKLKLKSFSEQGVNTPDVNNDENIKRCLETGEDIFHRTDEWAKKKFISLEEVGHKELKEWLVKYPEFYAEARG